ncbi:SIMPL domain-containing protein [Niallia sp. 03133]|uniref:SIMPL domain-containing protein n=1 Tax=Niallia sp. 03133 TaxID=3458060 RepID=UPI0040439945
MTVIGNSILSLEPNVVKMNLGVVTQESELQQAQQENAQITEKIIQALLGLGISKENIQTAEFTVFPQYDYVDGKQQFKGYQVAHILSITIDNLPQTGKVIDTAVQNGANRISSITFTVKNKNKYYKQALQTALEDGIAKAQTLSKSMQVILDPIPVKMVEQTTEPAPIPYQKLASSEFATTIEPGQITIEAKLELEFNYYV